jgi:hypothetical protein
MDRYPVEQAGGRTMLEHWIPAEDLDELNADIVGPHRGRFRVSMTAFRAVDQACTRSARPELRMTRAASMCRSCW